MLRDWAVPGRPHVSEGLSTWDGWQKAKRTQSSNMDEARVKTPPQGLIGRGAHLSGRYQTGGGKEGREESG